MSWLDFSGVTVTEIGPDRVRIEGEMANPRTGSLKVSAGYIDSYVGEGQISYAGPGAVARARLALEIVAERWLAGCSVPVQEVALRPDQPSTPSGPELSATEHEPSEVRVTGRWPNRQPEGRGPHRR